jgi:hypothetical protein
MPSEFPRGPKLLKAALVVYASQKPGQPPTLITRPTSTGVSKNEVLGGFKALRTACCVSASCPCEGFRGRNPAPRGILCGIEPYSLRRGGVRFPDQFLSKSLRGGWNRVERTQPPGKSIGNPSC